MSKGSAPRPFSVSNEEYAKRWDAIFQKPIKNEQTTSEADVSNQLDSREERESGSREDPEQKV